MGSFYKVINKFSHQLLSYNPLDEQNEDYISDVASTFLKVSKVYNSEKKSNFLFIPFKDLNGIFEKFYKRVTFEW